MFQKLVSIYLLLLITFPNGAKAFVELRDNADSTSKFRIDHTNYAGSSSNEEALEVTDTDGATDAPRFRIFPDNGRVGAEKYCDIEGQNCTTAVVIANIVTNQTLGSLVCLTGEIAKYNGSAWECAIDTSGSNAITPGDGLGIDGNEFNVEPDNATLELSASDGTGVIRVKVDGITSNEIASGAIGAEEVADGSITLTELNGVNILLSSEDQGTGEDVGANSIAEDLKIGDGTIAGSDTVIPTAAAVIGYVESYVATNLTDTLSGLTCTTGQIPKYNGAEWVCAIDAGGSAYTAGTGLTLSGSEFSSDLGTSIESAEITDGTVTLADLDTTAVETTTIDSLTDGDDLVTEASVEAYVAANAGLSTTLNDTQVFVGNGSNLATGVSLSGDATIDNTGVVSITADAITTAEIAPNTITADDVATDAITADELADAAVDFTAVDAAVILTAAEDTLSDFAAASESTIPTTSAVAAFVASQIGSLSDNDTLYSAGTGLTLAGTVFSSDLGTSIESAEITDGTVTLADLDTTAVETTTIDSLTDGDDLVTEASVEAYVAANGADDLGNHTATSNIILGIDASTNYLSGDGDNEGIKIGSDGKVTIESTNITSSLAVVGNIYANGTITSSDKTLKTDIQPLSSELEKIKKVNAVQYKWINPTWDKKLQYGVIAQEIEDIYPNIVYENEKGTLGVNYQMLIAPLIKSVQELSNKVDQLEKENIELRNLVQ